MPSAADGGRCRTLGGPLSPPNPPPNFSVVLLFFLLFFPSSLWVLSCPSGVAKAPEALAGWQRVPPRDPPLHYCPGPPAAALWGGCTPQPPPNAAGGAGLRREPARGSHRGLGGRGYSCEGAPGNGFITFLNPPPPNLGL